MMSPKSTYVDAATSKLQKYFLHDLPSGRPKKDELRANVMLRYPVGTPRDELTTRLRSLGAYSEKNIEPSEGIDAINFRINFDYADEMSFWRSGFVRVSYDVNFAFDHNARLSDVRVRRHLTGF